MSTPLLRARANPNRSGQPVELGHDERVAGAHGGKGLVETGAGASAAGQAVIGVDALGSTPRSIRAKRCAVRSCLSVEQRAYPMRTVSMGQLYDKGPLMENHIVPSL